MSETTKKKDVVHELAAHIVRCDFDDLDATTVEVTKKSILDTLGVMAAASGMTPECRPLVELIKDAGGREESTIMGFGGRVPAWMAAFVNGALAHSLDYDDLYYEAPVHPSSPVISAALAVAERVGPVSGKSFIAAVTLGNDLSCRIGHGMHWKMDWNPTTVIGAFGATAASGKILNLDNNHMVSALGIALSEAAGTQEMRYSVGNHLGGLRDGYPARGGALSALMAQRGILGPENSFEGRAGLINVHFGGDFDRDALTDGLGQIYQGNQVSIKAWPTCGTSHVYIDSALRIMTQNNLGARDVETITLYAGDFAMLHCEPLNERCQPLTSPDAKYSIPYAVALAVAKGRVTIDDLTPEAIRDPVVLTMARRIHLKLDPAFNAEHGEPPGKVEIGTTDGRTFALALEFGYGHHNNPISTEDVVGKFLDCVSHAVHPVSRTEAEQVANIVMTLEDAPDVAPIIRLLS